MADSMIARVLVVTGIGAVGIGLLVMAVPDMAGLVGADESLIALLGVLALVQAGRTVRDAWSAPRQHAQLPDAHRDESATIEGETFDHALELSSHRGPAGRRNQSRVRNYLRQLAIDILVVETGATRSSVETQLDDGTWTDDDVAAALFTEDDPTTWRDRLRVILGRETTFQRRVTRVIAALERRLEGDADE